MSSPAAVELYLESGAASSCLNLQPVCGWGKNGESRQLAADHRHFVAAVEARTLVAVFVNFVGQVAMLRDGESHAREEIGDAREQAHAGDLVLLRLREQRFHQHFAAAAALLCRIDGDGTDFRQVHSVEMQRAAANDSLIT